VFSGHTAHVFSLDLSPAGNVLVTGSVDETVRLWDVRRGTCMNVLPAHSDPVTSVRFSPDGTVVCSGSYDGLVRLWSVATGACLRTIRVAADERRRDAGSSDEKNIRDAEEKRVAETPGLGLRAARELDASVASAPPSPVGHVRFSPNGAFLLINTLDGRVRLLDTRTGAVAKTFEGHVNGSYCVVSAFARLENLENETGISTCVISGSEDGAARAWEIQSRRLVGIAGGHAPAVAGSSPDEKEKRAEKHADAVVGVDFCSATQTLATCGLERDKTVTLWRARREA
jgi:COMPASS component SWD3